LTLAAEEEDNPSICGALGGIYVNLGKKPTQYEKAVKNGNMVKAAE